MAGRHRGAADDPSGRAPPSDRLRAAVARRLGVDARGLAALRIALGLLLLADLAVRAGDLTAFYTDAGVLPRAALAEAFPAFAAVSLHALSGEAWFQAALFAVAGALAVSLTLGYRTRLATAASLLLLASLHLRNPLVLNAGDAVLRRLLFWSVFLPLGARWSVDSAWRANADASDARPSTPSGRAGPPTGRVEPRGWVATVATAALLLQVVLVYAMNAAFKLQGERWLAGDAVRYVFELDHLTVLFGDALAAHPTLLVLAGRGWLAMTVGSVLLVLLTGRARTALVAAFVVAHLGMALTLRLGLFPLVSVAALLPFLPARAWDAVESRLADARLERIARRSLLRLDRAIPNRAAPAASDRAGPCRRAVQRVRRRAVPGVVAVLLALLLVWNAATIGLVDPPAAVASTVDPAEYRWDMFAPDPRATDGWYVVPGRLASGRDIDAFRGGPVAWEPPPEAADTFPSHRWFLYLVDLKSGGFADLRPYFAEYLCRQWNDGNGAGGDELVALSVYYVERPVRLDGPGETRRVELVEHACGTA